MLWVHWRMAMSKVRIMRKENPWMLVLFGGFVLAYLVAGFFLFYKGLVFVRGFAVVGTLLSQRVLFLIFGFFFVMLVFSNLIIGYSMLFRSRETNGFLALPVSRVNVFRWKFFESMAVASWALIFLSAPMMAAYGLALRADPGFYLKVTLLYVPFVVLPAAVGAWLMFAVVHALSKRWLRMLLITVSVGGLGFGLLTLRPTSDEEAVSFEEVVSFDQLLRHTRIGLNPWLPSAWMSKAVLFWSQNLGNTGAFYALLLTSNAIFAAALVLHPTGRWFIPTHSKLGSNRARRKQEAVEEQIRSAQKPGALATIINFLPVKRQAKALILKDTRLFLRDPSQWSQFSIFLGLLIIYVINLRNVAFNTDSPFWKSMISYLNLTACSLTLSTLTTRFVFPQFSLEGRRLWIIGLAPYGLHRVLIQKFLTNACVAAGITSLLMAGSGWVLKLDGSTNLAFIGLIVVMSFTLAGSSLGLGVLFPNLKEDNPSKIVTSFGGTLCLVVSFIYIVMTVLLASLPAILAFSNERFAEYATTARPLTSIAIAVISGCLLGFTMVPAYRRAKRLEF